jgi:alpha-D-xyloside xylohydrolase
VLEVAREYKKRGIPIDVIVIDYYHWKRCGDWRFDEEYFPNPKAMVQELRDMGIETMVSVWPQVEWRSENFEEMKQQGLLVKMNAGVDVQMTFHGNNVFMDATNPRTREYVWDKCKKNYADYGIQTFWLDEAEPEFTNYDFELYRYHAGSVSEIGNIYPREYSRLFYEGQQSMGQTELVNLVRCAWVGSQKYGALVWSGDVWSSYEDFRKQICAGLHMGLCGIPWWTTDIGGFHGGNVESDDFKELLIRWFQFGTFCPVMRLHGLRLPGKEIIDSEGEMREWTGADNEVWSYGEEAYRIMVKFIQIREKMRDYTRSLMKEAHLKGTPVMRTLFFEFSEDKKCWDIMDEYMYGADILVAPVCHEHQLEREVYLPEGAAWIHAGTGETYEGGKTYSIPAPMKTIPVFLKNGEQGYLIHEI